MRRTIAVLACLAAATVAGCSSAEDGTDITGRSAVAATGETPKPPAPKPSDTDGMGTPDPLPSTTAAGPTTFAMGERGTITNENDGDVLYVTVAQPKTVTDEYQKPEKGRFLSVTVTFEALQPTQDVNPYDFIVTTTSGERIDPTFVSPSGGGTELNSATLNTGEKARGAVTFDVPTRGVVGVAYAPVGQVLGTWRLT